MDSLAASLKLPHWLSLPAPLSASLKLLHFPRLSQSQSSAPRLSPQASSQSVSDSPHDSGSHAPVQRLWLPASFNPVSDFRTGSGSQVPSHLVVPVILLLMNINHFRCIAGNTRAHLGRISLGRGAQNWTSITSRLPCVAPYNIEPLCT